jgi:hypothetical protein
MLELVINNLQQITSNVVAGWVKYFHSTTVIVIK